MELGVLSGSSLPSGQNAQVMQLNHPDSVLSVITVPLEPEILCTGCQDGIIRLYDCSSFRKIQSLDGHARGVVALSVCHIDKPNLHKNTIDSNDETNQSNDSSSDAFDSPKQTDYILVSASGDQTINVWRLSYPFNKIASFDGQPYGLGACLSLSAINSFGSVDISYASMESQKSSKNIPFVLTIFAGCQNTRLLIQQFWFEWTGKNEYILVGSETAAVAAHTGSVYTTHIIHRDNVDKTTLDTNAMHEKSTNHLINSQWHTGKGRLDLSCGDWNLITGAGDGILHIWSIFDAINEPIIDTSQSNDQTSLTKNSNTPLYGIDINQTFVGHDGAVHTVIMCNNDLCSGSEDGTIRVWDISSGACKYVLNEHTSGVLALTISPYYDVQILRQDNFPCMEQSTAMWLCSGSADGTIRIWDPTTLQCVASFQHSSTGSESFSSTDENEGSSNSSIVLSLAASAHTILHPSNRIEQQTSNKNVQQIDNTAVDGLQILDKQISQISNKSHNTYIDAPQRLYKSDNNTSIDAPQRLNKPDNNTSIDASQASNKPDTTSLDAIRKTPKYIFSAGNDSSLRVWNFASIDVFNSNSYQTQWMSQSQNGFPLSHTSITPHINHRLQKNVLQSKQSKNKEYGSSIHTEDVNLMDMNTPISSISSTFNHRLGESQPFSFSSTLNENDSQDDEEQINQQEEPNVIIPESDHRRLIELDESIRTALSGSYTNSQQTINSQQTNQSGGRGHGDYSIGGSAGEVILSTTNNSILDPVPDTVTAQLVIKQRAGEPIRLIRPLKTMSQIALVSPRIGPQDPNIATAMTSLSLSGPHETGSSGQLSSGQLSNTSTHTLHTGSSIPPTNTGTSTHTLNTDASMRTIDKKPSMATETCAVSMDINSTSNSTPVTMGTKNSTLAATDTNNLALAAVDNNGIRHDTYTDNQTIHVSATNAFNTNQFHAINTSPMSQSSPSNILNPLDTIEQRLSKRFVSSQNAFESIDNLKKPRLPQSRRIRTQKFHRQRSGSVGSLYPQYSLPTQTPIHAYPLTEQTTIRRSQSANEESSVVPYMLQEINSLENGTSDHSQITQDQTNKHCSIPNSDTSIPLQLSCIPENELINNVITLTSNPDNLIRLLTKFVSFRSISSLDLCRNECWRAAKFVASLLDRIGADVRLVQCVEATNPVVMGRLGYTRNAPTIVIHGHYDVQQAHKSEGWNSDPFTLTGINGYLYGRGASDNKGPLLAAIFAAAQCYYHVKDTMSQSFEKGESDSQLNPINFCFLIEGEGENGSNGFKEAVEENLEWFQGATLLLNTNNVWLDEDRPCLTYGMRGVVKMLAEVESSKSADTHSGTDGGAGVEPLVDLCALLGSMHHPITNQIQAPGFYDRVAPLSKEEGQLYEDIAGSLSQNLSTTETVHKKPTISTNQSLDMLDTVFENENEVPITPATHSQPVSTTEGEITSAQELRQRWRQPSLTVHSIRTSSYSDSVIPRKAIASISVRTVPDQSAAEVFVSVGKFLMQQMSRRSGNNLLTLRMTSSAHWWLQNPFTPAYQAAADAIQACWGMKPLYVREGGTMRVTPYLEAILGAPALHLPVGQASDAPHQPNERIRLLNLVKGMHVMRNMFDMLRNQSKGAHPS